jgi:hypothetical protein
MHEFWSQNLDIPAKIFRGFKIMLDMHEFWSQNLHIPAQILLVSKSR